MFFQSINAINYIWRNLIIKTHFSPNIKNHSFFLKSTSIFKSLFTKPRLWLFLTRPKELINVSMMCLFVPLSFLNLFCFEVPNAPPPTPPTGENRPTHRRRILFYDFTVFIPLPKVEIAENHPPLGLSQDDFQRYPTCQLILGRYTSQQ